MDSYISFTKDDQVASVSMTMDNNITWMELTEQFYGFMVACGYTVDREDFAEYVIESTFGPVDEDEIQEVDDTGCDGDCANCEDRPLGMRLVYNPDTSTFYRV